MLYFIVNEKSKSGKGSSAWTQIKAYLESNRISYQYFRTEYQGHAARLAAEISRIEEENKKLIVIGGDGTVNEVLNGITDFERISLGVIPNGSGNDFVRGLKSERHPVRYMEKIQRTDRTCFIDLGEVRWEGCEKPRLFGISAGVGMDAVVCKKAMTSKVKKVLNKLHLGKLTYLILTVWSLFRMETANGVLTVGDERKEVGKVIFSAVMNFPAEGGGVPMAPKADARDGCLSVCSASDVPKWKTFFYLPIIVLAKHERIKKIKLFDTEKITWSFDKPMTLHTDGEYCGEVTQAEFRCLKHKLKVLAAQ